MLDQLPFPAPIGARDKDGRVCIGSLPSRSKHCRTRLEFYQPPDPRSMRFIGIPHRVLATDVDWMPQDSKTIAVLLDALRDVLHQKVEVPFDRGTLHGRLIENRFYLMEANKGYLWPRYKWWLPYNISGWHHVVPLLIRYETLHPTVLVAEPDNRMPTTEIPTGPNAPCPVRMMDSHQEWVRDLLAHRAQK